MMDNRASSSGGTNAAEFLQANANQHDAAHRENGSKDEACAQMQALMSQLEPNPIMTIQQTQPQEQPQDQLLQRYLQQQQLFQQLQQQEQLVAAYQEQQKQLAAAASLEQAVFQASSSSQVKEQQHVNHNLIEALQQQGFNVMGLMSQQQQNSALAANLFGTVAQQQQEPQQHQHMVVDPFQPLNTFAPSQPCASPPCVQEPNQTSAQQQQQQQQPIVDTPPPSPEGDSSEQTTSDVYAEHGILGPWSATSQALLGSMAYDAAAKSNHPPAKKARAHLKNKDKPKRPLSAYNIFFKEERQRILDNIPESEAMPPVETTSDKPKRKRAHKPHGKIGFENLAKLIGERWHDLDIASADYYRKLAKEDSLRYRADMEVYLSKQQQQQQQQQQSNDSSSSVSDNESHGISSSSARDTQKGVE